MTDPTSPTAPGAAAPDALVDHDLAAVVRAASIDEGSPGALYRCGPEAVAACVRALAADNERLREGFGRAVDAHEDDVLAVWRALGGTHEPPDDTAAIIDAVARLAADLARLRAPSADVAAIGARAATTAEVLDALRAEAREHGDDSYGYGLCRVLSVLPRGVDPDVTTLLALVAADRERHAAEVAGARAAALREAEDACRAEAARWESDARAGGVLASERRATARELADAVAALATKGAPDV